MSGLTLSLFGSPFLARDGVSLHLRSRKCLALLAYLALTGSSHRRAHLATLFWPKSNTTRAQSSLRYALWLLGKPLEGTWLVVDRDTVHLDASHTRAVDVLQFRDLLAQCQMHSHPANELCPECLILLAQATDLYQGDFMAGFTLRDSAEFDSWQSLEAGALRREMAGALERLSEGYAAGGEVEKGVAYAQRWVAFDPLHEPAQRCLMRLYAVCGQRSDALSQYEACQALLQEELGVPPDAETIALYQTIKTGQMPPPLYSISPGLPVRHRKASAGKGSESPMRVMPFHNLPSQPTPFVGREEELAQITQLLAEPSCRLLSLLGPGGVGKTRLAIRAAEGQIHEFPDGVYFVTLASIGSPELLASTIMDALGAFLSGPMDA